MDGLENPISFNMSLDNQSVSIQSYGIGNRHSIVEIIHQGSNYLGRLFSTIYLLDYASIYVSILRNIDPTPTLNIEKLKENLKQ